MSKVKVADLPIFDAADYLQNEQACAEYLTAVLEEGDPALLAAALGDVAKARGMSQVARESGLTREGLYKALSSQGNPSFATVLKVLHALGLRIDVQPAVHG
ncbi:MAG: putative addiction module antidote protein [Proteobacteria bacterium]|nr:putative addiction module antidote protein [Pseudomonadota bacterium]